MSRREYKVRSYEFFRNGGLPCTYLCEVLLWGCEAPDSNLEHPRELAAAVGDVLHQQVATANNKRFS
jgi:hypothetical protein